MGNLEIVGTTARDQSAKAMIVQNHALSVLSQPNVDFRGFDTLLPMQDKMNKGIGAAKDTANRYLDVVLPKVIDTVSNIDSYFGTHNAVADALVPGTDKQTAISVLRAVQEQAQEFQRQASAVVTDLQGLRDAFARNSSDFHTFSQELTVTVKADTGMLASIEKDLSGIDSKIGGAIAGVVLSGLAVAGGVIMVGVGALATVVTGGAATALVVGGVALTAVGVGGEVGASIALAKLLDMKSNLLREKAKLNVQVAFASGLASGMDGLAGSATSASSATQDMANAWTLLDNDLGDMVTSLKKGQVESDAVRTLFATAAQNAGKTVRADVDVIRKQLTGARTTVDTTKTAGELIRATAAELTAA